MDAVLVPLIALVGALLVFVIVRTVWISSEKARISRMPSIHEAEKFSADRYDEDDREFSGRVIRRLRARVIEGRVEVHWEFNSEFIRRGFSVTGQCRRNDGEWQPLVMEPYFDSGSWTECFNFNESRSYLFTVKKTYRFCWGIFEEAGEVVTYDQISFSLRKGKFLKEKKEVIRDRKELLEEVRDYVKVETEVRRLVARRNAPEEKPPLPETAKDRLRKRFKDAGDLEDAMEELIEEIEKNPAWSPERKKQEIERLKQIKAEMGLED